MNRKASGFKDNYKWQAKTVTCCGGWEQTYYSVTAPDGEIFCDDFTNGPLEDGIEICKIAIDDHKNGAYKENL